MNWTQFAEEVFNFCKLHLEDVGETRWQHFKHAMWVSWQLEKAAYAVFLHAFAPRWFTTYASDQCKKVLESRNDSGN